MTQTPSYYIKLKDVATGEIDGFITCFGAGTVPTSDDTFLLPDTVSTALVNHGTQDTHFYCNGALVAKPPKPSKHHVFDYAIKQWVADTTAAWAAAKQQRTRLLTETDWVVTKASEAGQAVAPEWTAYRQALRDITLQTDPFNLVWPVSP